MSFLKIIILSSTLLLSCNDQVELVYPDFKEAQKEQLFEKGWIPKPLFFSSMTDIYQRTNLDLNTCIFSYKLSSSDLDEALEKLKSVNQPVIIPSGISIPRWWTKAVKRLNHMILIHSDEKIYIAIDKENNRIFGWRNSSF